MGRNVGSPADLSLRLVAFARGEVVVCSPSPRSCETRATDMSPTKPNPLQQTVHWLANHTRFPTSRLEPRAEALLCLAAIADAETAAENERFLVQRRDGAKDSALKAHAQRRSRVHYKCDNSAKV